MYAKLDKVYEATFRLGQTSTTGDQRVSTNVSDRQPTLDEIKLALSKFTRRYGNDHARIFSAIKIDGQRAYKLARDGQDVEIPEGELRFTALSS